MKKPTREKVGSPLTMYRMVLAKRATWATPAIYADERNLRVSVVTTEGGNGCYPLAKRHGGWFIGFLVQ